MFLANVIEVLGINAPGNLLVDNIIHPRTLTLGNLSKSQSCNLQKTGRSTKLEITDPTGTKIELRNNVHEITTI
jgi:hypothetical protein